MRDVIERSVALAQSRPWRIAPRFVIALFAVLCLAPLAVQVLRLDRAIGGEKRALSEAPGWKDLAKLSKLSRRLEGYVNDHFGFRSELVRINSLARYHLGISSNPQVAVGRDGWLFYTRDRILEQHTGIDVFKPAELDEWARRIEAIRNWLARRDIQLVMLLAPEKNTIYPEMVPQFSKAPGTVTRADQVVAKLAGGPVPFVDPRAALLAAKQDRSQLYFLGDTHWSHRAAFVGYRMLIDELRRHFPALTAARLEDFNVAETTVVSDLAYLLGLQADIVVRGEVMTRRDPPLREPEVRAPSTNSAWGWPIKFYKTEQADKPRALVFGDSFTDYILGPTFLYSTFRDPVFTHHNTITLNYQLVEEVKPDVVVIVVAERYLHIMPGLPPAQ